MVGRDTKIRARDAGNYSIFLAPSYVGSSLRSFSIPGTMLRSKDEETTL